jgi:hypothetical protein
MLIDDLSKRSQFAGVEFIDESGGGPGHAPTQAITRKITGRLLKDLGYGWC